MAALVDTVMATVQVSNLTSSGSPQTFTDTSKTEAPWQIYRIAVATATYLNFDGTTVSSSNGELWPAGNVEYKKIQRGGTIGYIQASAAGAITISRMV